MEGMKHTLMFISNNWVSILVCIGLIVGLVRQTVDFFSKSREEQVEIAKTQIQQTMLKLITSAEIDFDEWNGAGSIKRSQVIEEIFAKYPTLSKVADQEEIIAWIDEQIDNSLTTLREIIKANEEAG